MTRTEQHFESLFNRVSRELGKVDDTASTGIIGFTGGGPVSMCKVGDGAAYVTVELSLNPGQLASAEGLRFELLYRGDLSVKMVKHRILFRRCRGMKIHDDDLCLRGELFEDILYHEKGIVQMDPVES